MSLENIFKISGAGLSVQRERMDVINENIANISTTRTAEGGPYKPKEISVKAKKFKDDSFDFDSTKMSLPNVSSISESSRPPIVVYDPTHPDAVNGYVAYPDINATEELVNMMTASTAYEANMNIFNASKSMILRTLDLGEG